MCANTRTTHTPDHPYSHRSNSEVCTVSSRVVLLFRTTHRRRSQQQFDTILVIHSREKKRTRAREPSSAKDTLRLTRRSRRPNARGPPDRISVVFKQNARRALSLSRSLWCVRKNKERARRHRSHENKTGKGERTFSGENEVGVRGKTLKNRENARVVWVV